MAAPHVAGAAALALQANPDLDGQQIKALLTASAEPLPGIDVHGQGAGRLDIARALEQGPAPNPPPSASDSSTGPTTGNRWNAPSPTPTPPTPNSPWTWTSPSARTTAPPPPTACWN
ncbi:S8 family serine peptidase, partial [Actinoalloteichus caeruleus]|uniref:S8 family serine peptidase n=1 Tax=Actinoalloteichus cyanogriseus TaxID=2893586 RepID=UPI000B2982B3